MYAFLLVSPMYITVASVHSSHTISYPMPCFLQSPPLPCPLLQGKQSAAVQPFTLLGLGFCKIDLILLPPLFFYFKLDFAGKIVYNISVPLCKFPIWGSLHKNHPITVFSPFTLLFLLLDSPSLPVQSVN